MKRRHTWTSLRVEELEQRDVPSTGLSGTEAVPLPGHQPPIEAASFQWGVGRGVAEAGPTDGLVVQLHLRRVVQG
jgi:hypothetical protein